MNEPGLWRDLREIKFRYIALIVCCLAGGSAVRSGFLDEDHDYDPEDYAVYEDNSVEHKDNGGGKTNVKDIIKSSVNNSAGNFKFAGDDWEDRQQRNQNFISKLTNEHSQDDVVDTLGKADFSQQYDNGVEVLMYRTRNERMDFLTTINETAALVFKDGTLIGYKDSEDWYDGRRNSAWIAEKQEESLNQKLISEIEVGLRRSELIKKLGLPVYTDYPGRNLEIMSYRTQSVLSEGYTTRNETTPLMFQDGVLIAKGSVGEDDSASKEVVSQLIDDAFQDAFEDAFQDAFEEAFDDTFDKPIKEISDQDARENSPVPDANIEKSNEKSV